MLSITITELSQSPIIARWKPILTGTTSIFAASILFQARPRRRKQSQQWFSERSPAARRSRAHCAVTPPLPSLRLKRRPLAVAPRRLSPPPRHASRSRPSRRQRTTRATSRASSPVSPSWARSSAWARCGGTRRRLCRPRSTRWPLKRSRSRTSPSSSRSSSRTSRSCS